MISELVKKVKPVSVDPEGIEGAHICSERAMTPHVFLYTDD
jgi:hypothetical protein